MNKLGADKVLEILLEGNRNFMNSTPQTDKRCFKSMKGLKHGQNPGAIVFGCADSRVAAEIVFDCGLGELFVVRTAGTAIGPNVLDSIEYAVKHLEVPLLIILAHQNCGVMKHALEADLYNDEFENLVYQVQTVKNDKNITCYDDLAKSYTAVAKNRLLKKSATIRNAVEAGKLKIVRAYFSFDTGEVEILKD